jgi:hypothetical protein
MGPMWTDLPDGGCFARVGRRLVHVFQPSYGGWRWIITSDGATRTIIRDGWCVNKHDSQAVAMQTVDELQRIYDKAQR